MCPGWALVTHHRWIYCSPQGDLAPCGALFRARLGVSPPAARPSQTMKHHSSELERVWRIWHGSGNHARRRLPDPDQIFGLKSGLVAGARTLRGRPLLSDSCSEAATCGGNFDKPSIFNCLDFEIARRPHVTVHMECRSLPCAKHADVSYAV
ncbi:hypothetical protein BKA93DRAFT_501014 [Sparassis latifolia]